VHHYSVQLRITGENLSPDEISNLLKLQPNQTRIAGQRRGRDSTWTKSLWSYDGSGDDTQREWMFLDEGLMFVMNKLWSKKDLINSFKDKFDVVWWCGHFQTSFDGGPTFSISLLEKLAEFGVPLFLDNYFTEDQEPGDANSPGEEK
jgi:hypothetical protein